MSEESFDLAAIGKAVRDNTWMVHVQRSCGYAWRPSISVDEIGRLATWLKAPSLTLTLTLTLT